ncbi:glutamine repeat -1 [Cordyceps militaris]|uniref:Glutamine repeat-1 n=1 Tax=Cordyceps militaris TaxID=73501 RepID=A0A2H4SPP7_CORMI|nr:glutamine repeat -1 [Cordyceps militaris]
MFQGQFGYGNAGPQFNQQPGGQPNQQQQQQQPQMMFNPQQFAGMAPQGGFNPAANPQMMAAASQGMMQNPGMPNMVANGQMAGYQPQFAQPYGQVQQNFAPNQYMMGGMQGFPMNQQGMTQQQAQQLMQQRIQQQQHLQQQQAQHQQAQHQQHAQQHAQQQQHPHPHHQQHQQLQNPQAQQHAQHQQLQQHQNQQVQQQHPQPGMVQVGTPQRPPSVAQNSPAGQMLGQIPGQPQFSPHQLTQGTPQQGAQMHQHAQQHPQQVQQPVTIATPQTPTFPNSQGPNAGAPFNAPPLSPASESREKERFALLLDINHELLYEVILLQHTQTELKKESSAANGNAGERKPTEEESLFQQDYVHCMRRLQANLSYMAAQADRKAETKAPPFPSFMTAPPLNLSLRPRAQPMVPEGSDAKMDPATDREERDRAIKDLYRRLQAAYPGVDFKKESAARIPQGHKPGNPAGFQGSPIPQKTPQIPNVAPPQVS